MTGDLKQAFLRVRINERDRDALRFHWIINEDAKQIQTLRFTRALFGLGPSPFLLGGTIAGHMEILEMSTLKKLKKLVVTCTWMT